ncbi:hypothetical protein DFH28DRAFT_1198921 [Melampsora americana]|nr:hypothetical protein DFH28DRAFT_1198921 [Melampsora americana]
MEYSDIELNALAKKYSKKRAASAADEMFLLELHDQLEKIITINCIVRRISRDMADMIFGKTSPYRGISGYQVFQGSEQVTTIIKENGGIRAPGTNAKVGEAWNRLSKAQQEEYNLQASESARKRHIQKVNKSQRTATSHVSVAPSTPIDSQTQEQIDTSLTSRAAKFRTLAKNVPTVQQWMADLHPVANKIAKTYQVQIAIICVSSFLGEGNMQMVEATPRLRSWFELEKALNPQNHPLARMQSAVTGWASDELAEMGRVSDPDEITKARIGLNRLINIATKNKFKKWPWTNQTKLKAAGYQIQLLPGSSTTIDIITRASNLLLPAQAIDVNESLSEGKILVVKNQQTATNDTTDDALVMP